MPLIVFVSHGDFDDRELSHVVANALLLELTPCYTCTDDMGRNYLVLELDTFRSGERAERSTFTRRLFAQNRRVLL